MNAYEVLSIVLSVIALVGVFATVVNVSYKLGQHNQRLMGHDIEIKELKVSKVSTDRFDMLLGILTNIQDDLKTLKSERK
jgi:hypothetical protein